MDRKSGIYRIINITNNKIYIGSAKDIAQRWAIHKSRLVLQQHHSVPLQRAYNKYGASSFIFEVVEYCEISDLLLREQYYIDTLHPEYNVCKMAGSCIGHKRSEESKQKQREAMLGRKPTEETRAKLKLARARRVFSDETKRKISEANKGKHYPSEETKLKIILTKLKNGTMKLHDKPELSEEEKHKHRQEVTSGALNGSAKLTEKKAIAILTTDKDLTNEEVAKKYKVTVACIKDLRLRRSWKHLDLPKVITGSEKISEERKELIKLDLINQTIDNETLCEKHKISLSTLIIIKRSLGLTNNTILKKRTTPNHDKGKKLEYAQGAKNINCKLNDDKVREIRDLLKQKKSCAEIGRLYNVSNVTIANIRDGKIWTQVI